MNSAPLAVSCLALLLGTVIRCAAAQDLYSTGFEADEAAPFTVGPLPQNGWIQVTGPGGSRIVDTVSFEDSQSLAVAASSQVDREVTSAAPVVYVDGWFDPPVGVGALDLFSLPPASAIFYFNSAAGLVALDGNGNGGGIWVTLPYNDFSTFTRFTTRLDFTNHTWDLYVNESREAFGLGFKDNSINELNGFRIQSSSEEEGYFDSFTITTVAPAFIVVDTPTPTRTTTRTSTRTPTPTSTRTSSSTPTSTPTATPTPSLTETPLSTSTTPPSATPTGTPLQPGTAGWWFSFALHWAEMGITAENAEFNDTRPGAEDATINAKDLLYFLSQSVP